MGAADVPSTCGATFLAADAESTYEPNPTLTYRWDPKNSNAQVRKVFGTELYAYAGRSEYVGVLHVMTSNLAESPHAITSVLLAHARFGDSSFGFRFPILILG